MNRFLLISMIFFNFLISSCTSNEIGNAKDVSPDAVYFDYEVWAEEGKDDVTVNLQFRMGGPNGTTLVLDEPANVLLDGEQLLLDSAKFSGAYYELQKPLASFSGKHSIVFTDLNKKEYKEEFEFIPFSLSPELPKSIKRGDLVFNFTGLEPVEYLHVSLTDTSFASDDINDVDTVKNGRIVISAERLSTLKNGPINLQFYKEMTKPVKNATREGGILNINYGLKRQFELTGQIQ
jgi:hypothetical protein